jgi:putative endonuclease
VAPDSRSTTERGRAAETLVAHFLEQHGYVILARNLRVGRGEIDLVALDGQTLVCIEVRSSRSGAMVHPLLSINATKRRRMRTAALKYAAQHRHADMRIDVVSVTGDEIEHLEGAIDFSEM